MDPSLRDLLSEIPLFTFRRANLIASILVKSEYRDDKGLVHCKYRGTYMCGACGYCRYMDTSKNPALPNGQTFKPHHFANCQTFGVVYLLNVTADVFT